MSITEKVPTIEFLFGSLNWSVCERERKRKRDRVSENACEGKRECARETE